MVKKTYTFKELLDEYNKYLSGEVFLSPEKRTMCNKLENKKYIEEKSNDTKMEFKDYEPIKLEYLQTDIEKIMYQINQLLDKDFIDKQQWSNIQFDLQNKINWHKRKGEWL